MPLRRFGLPRKDAPDDSTNWHDEVLALQSSNLGLTPDPVPIPLDQKRLNGGADAFLGVEGVPAKLLSSGARAWLEEVLTEQRWHNESAGINGRTAEAGLPCQ
jgi:hypothetical protein